MQPTSPSSTTTRVFPRLPFELLSEIIKKVPERIYLRCMRLVGLSGRSLDLSSSDTSKFSRFRELWVRFSTSLSVQNWQISSGAVAELRSIGRAPGLPLVELGLLPKLTTLRIEKFIGELTVLNRGLALAIILHPSLETFAYDRWCSSLNPYDLLVSRICPHPLTIERITLSDFDDPEAILHHLYNRLFPFIPHHQLHVQALHVSSLQLDGFPLPLLLDHPIGLVTLRIIFYSPDPAPKLLTQTSWLFLFLEKHPLLERFELDHEGWNQVELIRLPWRAFSWIKGLKGMSSNETVAWDVLGRLDSVVVTFKQEQEKRKLVGLTMERSEGVPDPPPSLTLAVVEGLVLAFPDLEDLQFRGSFVTPEISQTIAAFAGFKLLRSLAYTSNVPLLHNPIMDRCDADLLLDQLDQDPDLATLSLPSRSPPTPGEDPVRLPLLESDRNDLRNLLYYSGLLGGTPVRSLVTPFEQDWRKLVVAVPSLKVLQWEVHARDRLQIVLRSDRGEWNVSSSIFNSGGLECSVCFCDGEGEFQEDDFARRFDQLVAWERPPLFEQSPDFVPAFTLD